jgi:hypothetical protein
MSGEIDPASPSAAAFRCRACGVPLTPRLRLLADRTAIRGRDGEPYLPRGTFAVSEGDFGPRGDFVVHLGDLVGVGRHADARRHTGCCGPSGTDGVNRVCREGHAVATECSDCWMPHAAHLGPEAVSLDPAGFAVDPSWTTWNEGVVAVLAGEISGEGAFHLLPVLADALEDAGCTDPHLLGHLRSGMPHQAVCWVADTLLGRGEGNP